MFVLYFLLFVVALFAYINKRDVLFLVCVFGLVSRLFMLDTSVSKSISIGGEDLALFLSLILLPFIQSRNKHVFSVNNDVLTKWVYIFIALYLIELIITVIIGHESFYNSLKVIRGPMLIVSFFVFKTISLENLKEFLKIGLVITIVQGVLYLLQFTGIYLLSGHNDEHALLLGTAGSSAINTPTLLFFYIFYVFKADYLKKYRVWLFTFLMLLLFLSFIRGRIIAVLLGIGFLVLKGSEKKRRTPIILAFLILIFAASHFIDAKSDAYNRGRTIDEITYVLSNRGNLAVLDRSGGTLSFRIGMLAERIYWLIDNPEYLVTGVGTMHEDSPTTQRMFNFQLGTHNENRASGYAIIDSGDITWVPVAIRYGLIGLFIHIVMFWALFKTTYKRKDLLIILAAFTLSWFVASFDGPFFDRVIYIYQLALCYALVSRANLEKKQMLM